MGVAYRSPTHIVPLGPLCGVNDNVPARAAPAGAAASAVHMYGALAGMAAEMYVRNCLSWYPTVRSSLEWMDFWRKAWGFPQI